MELFKSGFKSVLGAQQQEEQLSYAETVICKIYSMNLVNHYKIFI